MLYILNFKLIFTLQLAAQAVKMTFQLLSLPTGQLALPLFTMHSLKLKVSNTYIFIRNYILLQYIFVLTLKQRQHTVPAVTSTICCFTPCPQEHCM